MLGERMKTAHFGPRGLWGDRGWALRDPATGKNGTAKKLGDLMLCAAAYVKEPEEGRTPPVLVTLPNGTCLRTDDPDAAERLSRFVGQAMTLDSRPGAHFDDYPIHVVATASLEALARARAQSRFDLRRFRPNILIDTQGASGFPETAWLGKTLKIGSVLLKVEKPTERCVMTTHPQADLPKDPEILKTIVREAENCLGVYASVVSGGSIAEGDRVELI